MFKGSHLQDQIKVDASITSVLSSCSSFSNNFHPIEKPNKRREMESWRGGASFVCFVFFFFFLMVVEPTDFDEECQEVIGRVSRI